jgi:hypothetical protein
VFHNFVVTKDIFTGNPASGKSCPQRLAHFTLVSVSFRTIEVPKSSCQRVSGSTYRRGGIRNQGAKPKYRHMAGSVVERHSLSPKVRRFDHDDTSAVSRVRHYRSEILLSTAGRRVSLY